MSIESIFGDEYLENLDLIQAKIKSEYEFDISDIESISEEDKKVISVSPLFDIRLGGGVPEGSTVLLSGPPKCGKDQPLDSVVYTRTGPKAMRDIQIGDHVCSPNGNITSVVGIFPQGKKDVYEITFCDGTKTKCGIDHLWYVQNNAGSDRDKRPYEVMSLKEILDSGLEYADRPKWRVPITEKVYFDRREVKINPYILGCLLGDGGLTNSTPVISNIDSGILDRFEEFVAENGLKLKNKSGCDYSISKDTANSNVLTESLRHYRLMGLSSHEKFIPDDYKYSCINHRVELIKGIMDTDGSNDRGIRAEYSSVSKKLAEDVAEVIRSLGYKCKISQRYTTYTGSDKQFLSYRVAIAGKDVNELFSLSRKRFNNNRSKPDVFKKIISVEKLGEEETQCIKVCNDDGLYLTNDFTVTHNTTLALQIALGAQQLDGRPVFYFDIEGRFKKMNLHTVEGLNTKGVKLIRSKKGRILSGDDHLNIAYDVITTVPGAVVILDSTSQVCSTGELESSITGSIRSSGPKLMAFFTKKISPVLCVQNATVIMIQHIIADTGISMKQKAITGGNKIQYQGDVNLECTYSKEWLEGDNAIGKISTWKVITSALGAPSSKFESKIRFGKGLDKDNELISLGKEVGLITGSTWMSFDYLADEIESDSELGDSVRKFAEESGVDFSKIETKTQQKKLSGVFKVQGEAKAIDFLRSHEYYKQVLLDKIKEAFS